MQVLREMTLRMELPFSCNSLLMHRKLKVMRMYISRILQLMLRELMAVWVLCDKNGRAMDMGTQYMEHNNKIMTHCKNLSDK